MTPKPGDILVSNPTATVAYHITVVGGALLFTCGHHADAVALAMDLARDRCVDAWLTEDDTHFLNIGSWREEVEPI